MGKTDYERREKELNNLKFQVQAHISRTSHLYGRLLNVIDNHNLAVKRHAEQLSKEVAAKERLSEKLDRYLDIVKVAELERDDMKDAVVALVEKEPLRSVPSPPDDEQALLSYAASIISTLRMERDRDRRAHQNFKNRALSRISELEAKVGSLSTELEMCINNTSSPHHHHLHPDSKSEPFTEDLMSEDEAIQILELTASKNRILEQEIQRLTEKLGIPVLQPVPMPDTYVRTDPSMKPAIPSTSDEVVNSSSLVAVLDDKIKELGAQVNAFQRERDELSRYIVAEGFGDLSFEENREDEDDATVEDEANETIRVYNDRVSVRERELEEENARLVALIEAYRAAPTRELMEQLPEELLDGEDGEMTMELATPLIPSASLNVASGVAPSEPSSPADILEGLITF